MLLLLPFALAQEVVERAVPVYPEAAQKDRVVGTVVVELDVAVDGTVTDARIASGLREDVDAASLDAARKLRFAPLPQPVTIQYAFTFALKVDDPSGQPTPGSLVLKIDDDGGLDLPGVEVHLVHEETGQDYVANDDGIVRASFLAPGTWKITLHKPGFSDASATVEILPGETRTLTLQLSPRIAAETIVVVGTRQRWHDVERAERKPDPEPVTGQYVLTRRDVESTPGALEDVTRAVHKLPGVASDGDMLGTFAVRGAPSGEVVFLLDRIPLDNPFHLAGFNSIFNPDMLDEVHFYSSAPPSTVPDSTAAVMDVRSWDGERMSDRKDIDGAIDVSMSTARAMVQGPLGDDFTFAVAARRSYLEAYFGVMKAVNLLDTAVAAPEYDELSLRGAWHGGPHKVLITLMRTSDALKLVDSDDESTITIDGTFDLYDQLYLAAVDHSYVDEYVKLHTTLGFTFDDSHLERDFAGSVTRDVQRQQYVGRLDSEIKVGAHQHLDAGSLVQIGRTESGGPVEDTRYAPTWAAVPLGDFGRSLVELAQPELEPQVAVYAQHRYEGPVNTRLGVRGTWVGRNEEVLLSPSFGLSVPLPTGTIPKIAGGLYHHVPDDPLTTDAVLGNPDLKAERSWQGVVGVDQGIPFFSGGLLRVEAYYSYLDQLVVNPDHETSETPYQNLGTGHNLGGDVMLAARTERVSVALNASFLDAKRTNPLNTVYAETVTPSWAQTWTVGASAEWQMFPKWRLTGRYDFHTGRPMSTVEAAGDTTIQLADLNDYQLGDYHSVDWRIEYRHALANIRWSAYLEVLNTFYFKPDFLPIANVEDGVLEMGMLSHLPIRPFLGVRADF